MHTTPYSHHISYLWAPPPDFLDQDQYDEMEQQNYPDTYYSSIYQPEYSTSPYSQVEEEKSFPHLMPFLENYKHVDSNLPSLSQSLSTASSSLSTSRSLSSSHPPLFLTPLSSSLPETPSAPQHCNDQLPPRFVSLPTIITQSRNNSSLNHGPVSPPSGLGRPHTVGSAYENCRRGLLPTAPPPTTAVSLLENGESEDESEGSEISEDETMESSKRRSAIALLPLSDHHQPQQPGSKKTVVTNQPKKRQRTSPSQLEVLEKVYQQEKLPSSDLRKELAVKLKMTPRRVQVWFQNKRAKEKRMSIAK